MKASPVFWDKIAVKYSKQPIADEGSYQQKLEKSQSYFQPDMELLESIRMHGFEIDYEWRPGKRKAVFVVAKKGVAHPETVM